MSSLRRHPALATVPLVALFAVAYLYPLVRMLSDAVGSPDLGANISRVLDVPLYGNVLFRTFRIRWWPPVPRS